MIVDYHMHLRDESGEHQVRAGGDRAVRGDGARARRRRDRLHRARLLLHPDRGDLGGPVLRRALCPRPRRVLRRRASGEDGRIAREARARGGLRRGAPAPARRAARAVPVRLPAGIRALARRVARRHVARGVGADDRRRGVAALHRRPLRACRVRDGRRARPSRTSRRSSDGDRSRLSWPSCTSGSRLSSRLPGLAVEVSTAGLRKPVGSSIRMPTCSRACAGRAPDHARFGRARPDLVGADFEQALAHARAAGCESVAVYEGGRMTIEARDEHLRVVSASMPMRSARAFRSCSAVSRSTTRAASWAIPTAMSSPTRSRTRFSVRRAWATSARCSPRTTTRTAAPTRSCCSPMRTRGARRRLELVNADCVLIGEEPRIAGRRDEMRARLAGALAWT